MNILMLPAELLLNIFNRNFDIASIENVKKVHSRFRAVVIRYKLDLLAVETLTITRSVGVCNYQLHYVIWTIEAEIYEEKYQRYILKSKCLRFNSRSRRETATHLQKGLKELSISSVEALCFVDTKYHCDADMMFEESGIDFSGLTSCECYDSDVKLTFLDDFFFEKLLLKSPRTLNFSCETSVTLLGIVKIIDKYFDGFRFNIWNLGRIQGSSIDIESYRFMSLLENPISANVDLNKKEAICMITRETNNHNFFQQIAFMYE